jgi:beta-xylosidase
MRQALYGATSCVMVKKQDYEIFSITIQDMPMPVLLVEEEQTVSGYRTHSFNYVNTKTEEPQMDHVHNIFFLR